MNSIDFEGLFENRKRASTKVFVFYFYFFGPAKLIIHLQWDLILIEGLRPRP